MQIETTAAYTVCTVLDINTRRPNFFLKLNNVTLATHTATPVSCGFVFQGKLDPKKLQLQLTGFLEKSTGMFMEELWGLLVDAQSSLGGIPSAFLQDKKQEMLQAKVFGLELKAAKCFVHRVASCLACVPAGFPVHHGSVVLVILHACRTRLATFCLSSTGAGAQARRGIAQEDGRTPAGDGKGRCVSTGVSVLGASGSTTNSRDPRCPGSTQLLVRAYRLCVLTTAVIFVWLLRGAAATRDAGSSIAPGNLSRPGGRRASRWGVSAAPAPNPAVVSEAQTWI